MTMTAENPTAHETLRKADLATLANLLESQRLRTTDLAITGHRLRVVGGNLVIEGVDPTVTMDENGVSQTDIDGTYALGEVAVESLAQRIDVSRHNLRKWRANHVELFDDVANYFLNGNLSSGSAPNGVYDTRVHTLRLLAADQPGGEVDGMVRAVLGGRYQALDSVDALIAVTEGMAAAGLTPDMCRFEADLTESRMVLKVGVPQIAVLAPKLLGNYRSPFTGLSGNDIPQVFAGLVFSNSEVGRGAWTIAPRIVFKVCDNGQTITKDAFSKSHAGGRLEEGVIEWSQATQRKHLELITSQTADAVKTYLSPVYLQRKIDELAEAAKVKTGSDPEKTIAEVTRHTGVQTVKGSILEMFVKGGEFTAGGVMNAYTAAAQVTPSADRAFELENKAVDAMQWVAARSR